jgi:hypothetical protein
VELRSTELTTVVNRHYLRIGAFGGYCERA